MLYGVQVPFDESPLWVILHEGETPIVASFFSSIEANNWAKLVGWQNYTVKPLSKDDIETMLEGWSKRFSKYPDDISISVIEEGLKIQYKPNRSVVWSFNPGLIQFIEQAKKHINITEEPGNEHNT